MNDEVLLWNDGFNTGIAQIDKEHRILVKLINKLAHYMYNDPTGCALNVAFNELTDYAHFHFQSEERIWARYFPNSSLLKQHEDTHSKFILNVMSLKTEEKEGISIAEIVEDTVLFLTKWLTHHILGGDMNMSKVVLGLEAGLSMHDAQDKADKDMPEILRNTPFGMHEHFCRQTLELKKEINDRKEAEKKLKLIARVFQDTKDGITITDAEGIIVDVNPPFSEITGFSREEAIGKTPRILTSGKYGPDFYKAIWNTLNDQGYWKGEIWNRKKDGELYLEILTISKLVDEKGDAENYIGMFSDITETRQQQQTIALMAHYDVLTGLPNRVLLADRLSQAMLQCQRHDQSLAVLFLDLDSFKLVNDAHGHAVGDELLIALSQRMKAVLREGDTLARIGGDEFIVVLTDLIKVEDCGPILERFLLATSEPVTVGDTVLNVSASIGVTLYPQDGADADLLMRHADQAMYVAKESGKNRYHLFDTAYDDAVKVQRNKLAAIRSALDNHQFVLYYQPKVNMLTGMVIGVEALIRWQHPERGLLAPIEFLPIIENNPMSIEMGEWVIETALIQISQWQEMGLNLPLNISVNIAAVQLQQSDFTDRLARLLAAHPNVEPRYLELEVLETSALDDIVHVSATMDACIALGVRFALDDFGTGYSSLTYLRHLPANLIKIDQSFVRDMLSDPDDLAIVKIVIALAKSFQRDVIAEGVETIEHGTALLKLGCELAQGYGIARPMPAGDFPAWVSEWEPDVAWQP